MICTYRTRTAGSTCHDCCRERKKSQRYVGGVICPNKQCGLPCRTGQLANMSVTHTRKDGRSLRHRSRSTNHLSTSPHQSSINFVALLECIVSRRDPSEHERLNHFSNREPSTSFALARAQTDKHQCTRKSGATHTQPEIWNARSK